MCWVAATEPDHALWSSVLISEQPHCSPKGNLKLWGWAHCSSSSPSSPLTEGFKSITLEEESQITAVHINRLLIKQRKAFSQKPTQSHTSAIIFLNSKSKQISSVVLSSKHDLIRHFIPRIQHVFFFWRTPLQQWIVLSSCCEELTAQQWELHAQGQKSKALLPLGTRYLESTETLISSPAVPAPHLLGIAQSPNLSS